MHLVWTTVTAVLASSEGIQRLAVGCEAPAANGAVCYPGLTGACAVGDRVLLNATAVDLGLGTGGWHFVVAREGEGVEQPSGGHVMKLRYTPLQLDVESVEEAEASRAVMATAEDLEGMPVVCCGLHSQVAAVAAACKTHAPGVRIAYVMSDAASLPLALSDLIRALRSAGLVDTTVSAGQAFGGEFEAVTLHSGLIASRHVARADVAIVANGPGVTGTNTPFGHGAVAQAQAIDAAAALGGKPACVLRLSFADARERHRGVSHHTLAVLGGLAYGRAVVPVPSLPDEQAAVVERALADAGVWERHDRAEAQGALPAVGGVDYRSMGRSAVEDPAFFAAAAAAGEWAARVVA